MRGRLTKQFRSLIFCAVLGAALGWPAAAQAAGPAAVSAAAPVVLFPAFHFSTTQVTVDHQRTDPSCPASGSFTDRFGLAVSGTFNQVCRDELLTLRYDPTAPAPQRFREQPGVTVRLADYGSPASAPFYDQMYRTLTAQGLVAGSTLRVADYDSRLTPDLGDFLARTRRLVEQTSRSADGRPVQLVGHSNGPLYAQYLLTHSSAAWKARYIHGFTDIAGNLPGQGLLYPVLFTGLNIADFSFPTTKANAVSSARMYLAAPSSYMSAARPDVFGRSEVVVKDASTGRSYTPADYPALLTDAGLPQALALARHYIGFVDYAPAAWFPDVDVSAERGSGIPTAVGLGLANLRVGQVVTAQTPFFTADGDVNQENTTNTAVSVWRHMVCFRFRLVDNPGVDHFSLPASSGVLHRLVADLTRPRSPCQ